MTNTIDQLQSAIFTCRAKIKALDQRRKYLGAKELAELKEWRSLKRRLDKEMKQRVVQMPLF